MLNFNYLAFACELRTGGNNCKKKWIWHGLDRLELIIFDVVTFLDGF